MSNEYVVIKSTYDAIFTSCSLSSANGYLSNLVNFLGPEIIRQTSEFIKFSLQTKFQ